MNLIVCHVEGIESKRVSEQLIDDGPRGIRSYGLPKFRRIKQLTKYRNGMNSKVRS